MVARGVVSNLWYSNMAMENALFIGNFPIETAIPSGFPIATFDYRRVDVSRLCGVDVSPSASVSPFSLLRGHHLQAICNSSAGLRVIPY